jgi:SDR family mycofactocin-dependent oxidoreductase
MGRMDGKVALITGAARGQGLAHAVRLAEEGASIIATDMSDLDTTVRLVEEAGGRILSRAVDVRDSDALTAVVSEGVKEFGHIDIGVANAGIISRGISWELSDEEWQDVIDVNLTGVWKTVKALAPQLIKQNTGGSLILISSIGGLKGFPGFSHYSSSKHGVVGLMRALVNELSPYNVRVNTVHPSAVDTPMIQNEMFWGAFGASDREAFSKTFRVLHPLPVDFIEPRDIANAVLFLASDESRYVTGLTMQVDAGFYTRVG